MSEIKKTYVRLKDSGTAYTADGLDFAGRRIYEMDRDERVARLIMSGILFEYDAADGKAQYAIQLKQDEARKKAEAAAIDANRPHKVFDPATATDVHNDPATSGKTADALAAEKSADELEEVRKSSLAKYEGMKDKDLKIELDTRKVAYGPDLKKPDLIGLLMENDQAAAEGKI